MIHIKQLAKYWGIQTSGFMLVSLIFFLLGSTLLAIMAFSVGMVISIVFGGVILSYLI